MDLHPQRTAVGQLASQSPCLDRAPQIALLTQINLFFFRTTWQGTEAHKKTPIQLAQKKNLPFINFSSALPKVCSLLLGGYTPWEITADVVRQIESALISNNMEWKSAVWIA